jgi:hypothetical protein
MLAFTNQQMVAQNVSPREAQGIARDAYIYGYPLVLMDLTRRQLVNFAEPPSNHPGAGPENRFVHIREFPDPNFKTVIRPNADTLYSSAWLDLKAEPMVLSVPSTERYFLLPMLSMWTDVFAAPGTRTTGRDEARTFVIAGPGWAGKMPEHVELIRSPTRYVWIIGRTQANGKSDLPNVRKIQDSYQLVPLSSFGDNNYSPPKGEVDPSVDMKTPPPNQVDRMDAAAFFARLSELLKDNPPNQLDYPILHQMERVGFVVGKSFDLNTTPSAIRTAFEQGQNEAKNILAANLKKSTSGTDWKTMIGGAYGVDYVHRAFVARAGLGANLPQDAVYPTIGADSQGQPLDGTKKYVLHFAKGQEPPVNAFWSLTAYDAEGYFIPNSLQRQAIGDRDKLALNADGSLDIYLQADSPGKDKESNWLPVAKAPFNLLLRLYWPKEAVLDKSWLPPAVARAGSDANLLPTGTSTGKPLPQP